MQASQREVPCQEIETHRNFIFAWVGIQLIHDLPHPGIFCATNDKNLRIKNEWQLQISAVIKLFFTLLFLMASANFHLGLTFDG
jgi:hypothetical protein